MNKLDKNPEFQPSVPKALTSPKDDAVDVFETEITEVAVEVSDKNSVSYAAAEKFLTAVQDGMEPAKAARAVGTTLKKINNAAEMSEAIRNLVEMASLTSDVRRAMIRAGLDKMFMQSVGSEDLEERKHALAVAKQIAQDPEVGAGGEGPGVAITISDSLLTAIKDVTLTPVKEGEEK